MMSLDDDYNNGLSRDWIRVPISIMKIKKTQYSYYERKTNLAYDRIIWLNLNWTLDEVQMKVFSYLRSYFNQNKTEDYYNLSTEQAFEFEFSGLTHENQKEYFANGEDENKAPYTIQVVNPDRKSYYSPECRLCGEKKC